MVSLDSIDWLKVDEHYKKRVSVHQRLLKLLAASSASAFANEALEDEANYSAYENRLRDRILGNNHDAERRIAALARKFEVLEDAHEVTVLIDKADLKFLKVGVGSELSCIVNPKVCWVANTRTIWSHFAVNNNLAAANEALSLFRDKDENSKMAYQKWAALHGIIDGSLRRLAELSIGLAGRAGIEVGALTYLWADAIATNFYANYHST